jgi:hypothetical protein
VLTVFASWMILGEALSLSQVGGLALVMFGVSRLKPNHQKPVTKSAVQSNRLGASSPEQCGQTSPQ